MKTKRKAVQPVVVKINTTGLTIKTSNLAFEAMSWEIGLQLYKFDNLRKTNSVRNVAGRMAFHNLRDFYSRNSFLEHNKSFRATRAQAAAVVLAISNSTNPYLIELKAELLKHV
ncbi:MAG: hypothetical protein ACK5DD_10295 [Cyclobacteriaceae bacterium]|jgi:hypothetical protein